MLDRQLPIVKPQTGDEEAEAVREVLASGMIAEGPQTKRLEEEFALFTGSKYAIATVNGTAALHIALQASGLTPGDEVVTTAFTFIASSNSICFIGGIPVFSDIDRTTYCQNPKLIEQSITTQTKAILPVHIFGLPCNMPEIMEIAEKHDLKVIEDCAQAHGAKIGRNHVGNFGLAGCFSFYATKNMVSAEGGMITTNDYEFAEKCRTLKNHGRPPSGGYHHNIVGYNLRISDVHSAIARVQLKKLPGFLEKRAENASIIRQGIESSENLSNQHVPDGYVHSNYVMCPCIIDKAEITADQVINKLRENKISARQLYSIPSYKQPAYDLLRENSLFKQLVNYPKYSQLNLKNTEFVAKNHFEVPIHPDIARNEAQFIADFLKSV